jgi:hypothetical protein
MPDILPVNSVNDASNIQPGGAAPQSSSTIDPNQPPKSKMPPLLLKHLSAESPGDFHAKLLQKCKDLVKLSRDSMANFYPLWDKYDMAYRTERYRDEADVKAKERKEPEKMVIPMTYSQIDTFCAFLYQVYTQRPTFFEFSGTSAEDVQASKLAEAVMEYNLDRNKWRGLVLQQFILDIGKYGLGVLQTTWTQETVKAEQQVPMQMGQVPGMETVQPPMTTQLVDKVDYQGNKVINVSPYRFFPDPRLPITRFQEGEFCAHEYEYSEHTLQTMESKGEIAGLKYVPRVTTEMMFDGLRRVSFSESIQNQTPETALREPKFYIATIVQLEIVPSMWKVDGVPLGSSDKPEKYLVWYLNDSRIVKVEPMGYLHNQFTYSVSQFANDQVRFINFGLAELLEQLQDVQNWFINSHITSVRKVISNRLIVDPKGIEMQDLRDRNPILRLKPTAQGSGVDRWIKDLPVTDVTANHVRDAETIDDFAKQGTGITDNILGNFASGRRSATEARNVNQSAAARLLRVAYSIWECGLLPTGKQMLSNIRDGMDIPQLIRVVGQANVMDNAAGLVQFLPIDKTKLVGNYDFMIFDGTLPSQRGMTADILQELFVQLVQNPQLALIFQIDPRPLLNEILTLRGIRNLDQFKLSPDAAQQLIQLAGFARNATATTGAPGGGGSNGQSNPQAPSGRH